ncbi:MAG TPA: DNA alkylation repair protein [Thermoplasmata archaeon]|nr:DNA alkylation repair protein [Thermoplasmata archaeon]
MRCEEIIKKLEKEANPINVAGMTRFGINPDKTLGVSIPFLRKLAKELWLSGIHEARILAGLIDDPDRVTERQMDRWVEDFDSWDVCDQVCSSLFDKTGFAYEKAFEWTSRDEEFVKRAGFVMMAALSVHDKKSSDKEFERFLPIIVREAKDERNYVRKAVNWALRQIGKRNGRLNIKAIQTAEKIRRIDSKSARWIASDALRELRSEAVKKRLD